jgi:hypothetical protein
MGVANVCRPRAERPPTITIDQVEDVMVATLEIDAEERHPLVAGEDGRPVGAVEVNDRADLEGVRTQAAPHGRVKLSSDPLFVEKAHDVVGTPPVGPDQDRRGDPQINRQTSEANFRRRTLGWKVIRGLQG